MKHLLASLYVAAKISGLLPLTGSEYADLGIPKGWQVSSCRIFVPTNNASGISTAALYRQFYDAVMADHKDAKVSPILDQTAAGRKPTLGASVQLRGDIIREIIWRGHNANLELGTVVADVDLDRPNAKIARIKPIPEAGRYIVGNGRGTVRDLSEQEIKTATDATAKARKIVSGENICEEMRTVAAAAPATIAKSEQIMTPAKRRGIMAALHPFMDRDEADDGTILVSPLDWQDAKQARLFEVSPADITAIREEIGIRLQDTGEAINAVANRLAELAANSDDDRATSALTYELKEMRKAARDLLALMRL